MGLGGDKSQTDRKRKLQSPEDTQDYSTQILERPEVDISPGTIFVGRYRVIEELGQGGMGKVYRAFDLEIGEEIAIKMLKAEIAHDEKFLERFQNELKLARRISHKNVCRLYHFGREEGIPYITMEYVAGENLKSIVCRQEKLPEDRAIDIAKQICEGLAEAHDLEVIHRDLKPQNVMIDTKGYARIMDFGIARSLKIKDPAEAGLFIGTPDYISPEQSQGREADRRSDFYSLGVILYEMVTGRLPFEGRRPHDVVRKHITELPPDPMMFNPELSDGFRCLILKCLEKEAIKRYHSAEELLVDLRNIEKGISIFSALEHSALTPAFMVGARQPPEVERPVFVGRDKELQRLDVFLQEALDGKGRPVFITGEAGCGKTALIQEFSRRAQEADSTLIVVSGSCDAHTGIGDPYLPFREVLYLLTGDIEASWAAGTIARDHAQRLWNLIPLSVEALVNHGPGLIDSFLPSGPLIERARAFSAGGVGWLSRLSKIIGQKASVSSAANLQQSDLFEQFSRVVQSVAQKHPLLVVLEDLHWADSGSISLLCHLGRRIEGSRVLILGAFRPTELALARDGKRHPLEAAIHAFGRSFEDLAIDLGCDGDIAFVEALLDTEPNKLSRTFRKKLHHLTQGHPLFTIELLRRMQERRFIVKDKDEHWVEGPSLDWETLPARVEGIIGERLGQLSERLRGILDVACVEGETFTAEIVGRVMEMSEFEIIQALSNELEKRFRLIHALGIRKINRQRISTYRFRHILFQKYLYGNLDVVERAYKHERVGYELEKLYGTHASEISVQLAHHFRRAEVPERTIHYLEKAAERALRGYANQEAVDFLREIESLAGRLKPPYGAARQAYWKQLSGEACLGLGRIAESRQNLQQAAALIDKPVPNKGPKLLVSLTGEILRQGLHLIRPRRFVGKSRVRREAALNLARVYERLAELGYFTQEKLSAIHVALRALNLAERAGPSPELARNYANMGLGMGVLPLHPLAEAYGRKAKDIALKTDRLATLGYVQLVLAIYHSGIGRWSDAEYSSDKALEIFKNIGDSRRQELCLGLQGQIALYRGDFIRCGRTYEALYKTALRRGDLQNQCLGLTGQALSQLRLGNVDKAISLLKASRFDTLPEENRFDKLCASGILAQAQLIKEDRNAALRNAEVARQLFDQADPRFATLKAYPCVTEVFLTLWEGIRGRSHAQELLLRDFSKQACRAFRKHARVFSIGQPAALRYQGLYHWLEGMPEAARKAWEKSLVAAQQLSMPYEKALAYYEAGRHSNYGTREKYLSRAIEIFYELGAKGDLLRTQKALRTEIHE